MTRHSRGGEVDDEQVTRFAEVLIRVASGDFEARAERQPDNEALDALAYMINATIEEVGQLVRDVERQRDEVRVAHAQLLHSSRLALLGEIAGSVAHELTQPLAAMTMLVQLGRLEGRIEGAQLELLEQAVDHMSQIAETIRRSSRRVPLNTTRLDPAVPLREAVQLLRTLGSGGAPIFERIEPDLAPIEGDSSRLQQVFVNLIANARDAILQGKVTDGRVLVSVDANGHAIRYVVEDNGPGVPESERSKVFERFFTTKGPEGTGLGLALCRDIVEDHGGTIECEAAPAGGARFVVSLPHARAQMSASDGPS